MARPGITYHDVAEAAKQLMQRGDKVTIDRVRLMLKRGSDATISKHLQEWRRQCEIIIGDGFKEMPPDMVGEAVTQMWTKLNANAQNQYEQLKIASEEEIYSLTQENKVLAEEKQALANLLEKAQQRINNLDAEIQFLKRDLGQERQRREVEIVRANKAEEQITKLESASKSHLEDLKALYESQLTALREEYQKDKATFYSGLTQYKDLLENMRCDLMITSDKLQTAEKQVVHIEAELKRQQDLTQNWIEKARALEVDLTIAKEQINNLSQ